MSSFVREVKRPELELCPFHRTKFKKKGKFWHCPEYGQCGHSIGSRWRDGQFDGWWIQQTRRGRAWVADLLERIFDENMEEAG